MSTNQIQKANLLDLVMESKKVISVHGNQKFPARGTGTTTPIVVDHLQMVQPGVTAVLASYIAEMVVECNERIDKKNLKVDEENSGKPLNQRGKMEPLISMIAGSKFSETLAYKVAEMVKMPFLPAVRNGKSWKDLQGENVAYVADVIVTGTTMHDAVDEITCSRGMCKEIFAVFDFNFNLAKAPGEVKINSLLNTTDLLHMDPVALWVNEKTNINLFRKTKGLVAI